MYTKDKVARITLRLNEAQFQFVKSNADILGVSPSEFLRMVVNATMSTSESLLKQAIAKQGGNGRENDKAYFDHLV
jgi:uncharacterized protein (DUF1778 family)